MFENLKTAYQNKKFIKEYESFHMRTYPDVLDINGLPFHFPTTAKRIGITFSGGADSTLLLFLIANIVKQKNLDIKIYPIHNIRFYDTKPWLSYMAEDAHNYLQQMFPKIIQDINFGFIAPELELVKISALNQPHLKHLFEVDKTSCDVIVDWHYQQYLSKKLKLDFIYSGTTMNPPTNHEKAPKFRDSSVVNADVKYVVSASMINPFALITKDWIMAQYDNFGLKELFDKTRSCEADKDVLHLTWKVGDPYPPECGTCFFCQERKWGNENKEKYLIGNVNESTMLLRTRRNKLQEWIRNFLPSAK